MLEGSEHFDTTTQPGSYPGSTILLPCNTRPQLFGRRLYFVYKTAPKGIPCLPALLAFGILQGHGALMSCTLSAKLSQTWQRRAEASSQQTLSVGVCCPGTGWITADTIEFVLFFWRVEVVFAEHAQGCEFVCVCVKPCSKGYLSHTLAR